MSVPRLVNRGAAPPRRAALIVLAGILVVVALAACSNNAPSASGSTTTTSSHSGGAGGSGSGGSGGSGSHHGSGSGGSTGSGSKGSSSPRLVQVPRITAATITVNGHAYPVPRENPANPIDPVSDTGQQIVITGQGVLPDHLFANIGVPIIFTNLSSKPVTVSFISDPVMSPSIPTGGTWSYTFPDSYSVAFYTSSNFLGQIDVGAFTH